MAGIGEAASVIAVIQISQQVITLATKYYTGVKHARRDRERLCEEVRMLAGVLEKVQESVVNQKAGRSSVLNGNHIQDCLSDLESIRDTLDPRLNTGRGLMKRLKLRSAVWPFTGKDLETQISKLQHRKITFNLALTADAKAVVEVSARRLLQCIFPCHAHIFFFWFLVSRADEAHRQATQPQWRCLQLVPSPARSSVSPRHPSRTSRADYGMEHQLGR